MDLTIHLVGYCYKELSTSESVECIIDPLLLEGLIHHTLSLSGFVQGLGELKHVTVAVEVAPENFTVVGVITSSKALL